jgi:hypothetical protein
MKYLFGTIVGRMLWALLMLVLAGGHLVAYGACDFDNELCRKNPLMDDNERRLQEIERNQERLEQQQRILERERFLQQPNGNQ